jgi:predicted  nucleic acid-binding Zn-ribbon protein
MQALPPQLHDKRGIAEVYGGLIMPNEKPIIDFERRYEELKSLTIRNRENTEKTIHELNKEIDRLKQRNKALEDKFSAIESILDRFD